MGCPRPQAARGAVLEGGRAGQGTLPWLRRWMVPLGAGKQHSGQKQPLRSGSAPVPVPAGSSVLWPGPISKAVSGSGSEESRTASTPCHLSWRQPHAQRGVLSTQVSCHKEQLSVFSQDCPGGAPCPGTSLLTSPCRVPGAHPALTCLQPHPAAKTFCLPASSARSHHCK